MLFSLDVFIPTNAVGVRRPSENGKGGWMMLVIIIPIAGLIWLIVFNARDSQKGRNSWGECLKEVSLTTD